MAIITDLNRLRTKSHKFDGTDAELEELISCLDRELDASSTRGVGLSAIQINLPLQVAIIRTDNLNLNLYNAKIIEGSEMVISKNEGCLSMPGVFVDTRRMNRITIENGDGQIHKLAGFEAIVVQHELCHWHGQLITDYAVD